MKRKKELSIDAITRFRSMDLHDSKLLGIELKRRDGAVDDVVLKVRLLTGKYPEYKSENVSLVFEECVRFSSDLNLVDKTSSSDSLDEGECESVEIPDSDGVLQSRIAFNIRLCPPSGEMRIVAKGFYMQTWDGH
jgi:hypothetical protein